MSIYASISDVEPYIKFISDTPNMDLKQAVLDNSDSWINSRLLSNSLPIWKLEKNKITPCEPVPGLLKTAAVYYAASDIILSLYNGEEMPTQYDTYFNKAESMLNAYIEQMTRELQATELKDQNIVKHSHAPTYFQRKGRKRR